MIFRLENELDGAVSVGISIGGQQWVLVLQLSPEYSFCA